MLPLLGCIGRSRYVCVSHWRVPPRLTTAALKFHGLQIGVSVAIAWASDACHNPIKMDFSSVQISSLVFAPPLYNIQRYPSVQ